MKAAEDAEKDVLYAKLAAEEDKAAQEIVERAQRAAEEAAAEAGGAGAAPVTPGDGTVDGED